jgi:Tfp pilus assembly protein PilE
MDHRSKTDASGLILMEIVLAILIFAMLAAICISIFAKAHTLSRSSTELASAASEAENTASVLRASDSEDEFLQSMKVLFPDASIQGSTVTVWYDSSFSECAGKNASYRLTAAADDSESGLLKADISFYRKGSKKAVYTQKGEHAV